MADNGKEYDIPNYLQLPFEVYYERLGLKNYQLLSVESPKRFKDIQAVTVNMGDAYRVTLRCVKNSGSELISCAFGLGMDAIPRWLTPISEDDADFNWEDTYKIEIFDDAISFANDDSCDSDDKSLVYFGDAFGAYFFDDEQTPSHIILDALGTRVRINSNGFEVDEEGCEVGEEKILDFDELTSIENAEIVTVEELTSEWMEKVLSSFPEDQSLVFKNTLD